MCAWSQILNPVVIPVTIDVIYLRNKMPMVIHPYKMMYSIHFPIYYGNSISFGFNGSDHCEHRRSLDSLST